MPNSIATVSKYVKYLDEIYENESFTEKFDTPKELIKETANAHSILIAKQTLSGLADYSRASGFVTGDVTVAWETKTLTKDRGTRFVIDSMDDEETLGIAFGKVASQFMRTAVIPEVDAYRFSTYATNAGYTVTAADLDEDTIVPALDTAIAAMQDEGVDVSNCTIFLPPAIAQAIKESPNFVRSLDPAQNPNRNIGSYDGTKVVVVPQKRLVTAITLNSGASSSFGWTKASGAKNLNFLIVDPNAVVQVMKRAKTRIFTPDEYQGADAYAIDFRFYHDAWVLDNKVKGIYAHKATT